MIRPSIFSPARFFAPLALLFGALLVFITPPFQSPDEYNHFFRAFQVSEGKLFPAMLNNKRSGGYLPASLDSLKNIFLPLKGDHAAETNPETIGQTLSLRLNPADQRFIDFPNTAIYAPTGYISQAMGISLACYFTDRVLLLLYAARLANLIFWIALVWAALQWMPFQRQTMAFLALLPASLSIAASCNADVLTNGLAFYAIAVFCHQVQSRGFVMGWPGRSAATGALALAALNKLVFAPMALLAGLAGFDRFASWKKAFRQSFFPLTLALSAAFLWGIKTQEWFIPYDRYEPAVRDMQTLNPGVNPSEQLQYILGNPFSFVKTVATSCVRAAPSAAAHFVGKFGWEKNYLPGWILALLWLALGMLVFAEKNGLSPVQRLWTAAIVLICVILWAVTMYALWCPVGVRELDNWQGRYFVPLGPLVAMAIGVEWGSRWEKWIAAVAVPVLLAGNASLVFAVLGRYWSMTNDQ